MINAISLINPIQKLKPISFKGSNNADFGQDKFVMSDGAKLSFAKEIARRKILENMNDGREHGYLLSSDGRVLDEITGTEDACLVDLRNAEKNCILIHGHPHASPLSPQDVITLIMLDQFHSVESISPDGKISRLTKTASTSNRYDYYDLGCDISRRYCQNILDGLGIDYRENKENLIKYGRKLLEKYFENKTFEDEQVLQKLREFGVYKENDIKGSCKELCSRLAIFDNDYSENLAQRIINENMELIANETYTPIGIKAADDALYDIAGDYDLIYESTFFSE